MRKVRCGVLGLGRLGYWHAVNATTKIRNAEIVTVCDIDLGRAEKVAKELSIANFTNNPVEVMEDDSIDAVIIATPTNTHYELLRMASDHKKSIFVEKPITIDLQDAYKIRRHLQDNNTICQVGFMRRFDPAYNQAKKRIEAGDIGDPLYYKGVSRDAVAPQAEYVKSSGGIFVDVSIHDFDISRYLMGSDISSVSSNGSVIKYPFVKEFNDVDQGLSYIEFASGAIGDIEASRNAYYGYDIRAEVIGSEGSIFIGGLRHHDINILTKKGNTHDILPNFPERFEDAYLLELAHFFSAVEGGYEPNVTADDGVKALEVGLAARDSLLKQEKVSLVTSFQTN